MLLIFVGLTLTEAGAVRIAPTGVDDTGAVGRGGGGGGVLAGRGGTGTTAIGVGAGAAAAAGVGGGGVDAAGASAFAAAGLAPTAPALILNNCWPAFTVSPSCT